MPYKIIETKKFRKSLLKQDNFVYEKTFIGIERLEKGPPFEKFFNVHELNGKFKKYFSINITGDYRLIFYIDKNAQVITLYDIGTHSELYK